jgi:hypothetical protein
MTQKAVLFSLAGGGDRDLFFAPPEALEWCEQATPGYHPIPENVQAALGPFTEKGSLSDEETKERVNVTPGSADNDVALFLSCMCRRFDTTKQAMSYAAAQGWEISDEEYSGCIY